MRTNQDRCSSFPVCYPRKLKGGSGLSWKLMTATLPHLTYSLYLNANVVALDDWLLSLIPRATGSDFPKESRFYEPVSIQISVLISFQKGERKQVDYTHALPLPLPQWSQLPQLALFALFSSFNAAHCTLKSDASQPLFSFLIFTCVPLYLTAFPKANFTSHSTGAMVSSRQLLFGQAIGLLVADASQVAPQRLQVTVSIFIVPSPLLPVVPSPPTPRATAPTTPDTHLLRFARTPLYMRIPRRDHYHYYAEFA